MPSWKNAAPIGPDRRDVASTAVDASILHYVLRQHIAKPVAVLHEGEIRL
ncbi:hypothetical protein Ga0058931_2467 [Roseibaca calidilacus]|uniref:Uncharacterized protein n=1 Tax=Roseibaca calidilacus TaxID=1666912 RepID=A0ABP2C0M5_9RHOB|nr:hypothetical protein Ga0058931_2467 [Roseibaca calidilacus]